MATFSIFQNIVIDTPEKAEAFVNAIESSIEAQKNDKRPQPKIDFRLATRDDIIRMSELRRQKQYGHIDELSH
ncbi:MAG: hypothetical protein IJI45_02125 [Anaerolineaceae bacterium]|nr:hypothetical protein [Anaerolineaceae bacterium]